MSVDNFNWIYLSVIAILCLLLIGKNARAQSYQYKPIKTILTQTEAKYYRALNQATNNQYLVFSKVRIADILTPKVARKNNKIWWKAFTKISSKHVDFVLTDDQFNVIAVIELDDSSHQRTSRRKRDQFVNAAFKSADVPIIRQPLRQYYQFDWLKELP